MIVDGYLTQAKLESVLLDVLGDNNFIGREVRVPNSHRRWDMLFKISEQTYVIEFDGDQHYRDTMIMKSDREKDVVANDLGYTVVRITYWVQLTTETMMYYFGIDANIEQSFPHGFITSKIFHASYCAMGTVRFERELESLPMGVQRGVQTIAEIYTFFRHLKGRFLSGHEICQHLFAALQKYNGSWIK